ncbi:MAG: hypothetical protein ACU0DW_05900 [Shimia sp.]
MLGLSLAALAVGSYALGDLALDDVDADPYGDAYAVDEDEMPIVSVSEFLITSGAEPSHPSLPLVLAADQRVG